MATTHETKDPSCANNPSLSVVRVPYWGMLKSMLALAWATFRYPFTNTVIDLETGRILSREEARQVLKGSVWEETADAP